MKQLFIVPFIILYISNLSAQLNLTSFTADFDGSSILLKWTTESESENLGFILDRRVEGTPAWIEIASYVTNDALLGQGSTPSATDYEYLDNSIVPGSSYEYLLSDVDYNAIINNHPIISVSAIGTAKEGIINSDETWTFAESPFYLTSDVQIAHGVTLTIEPGVIVYGYGNAIQTWGILNADGNQLNNITFYDTEILQGVNNKISELFNIYLSFCRLNGGKLYPPTGYASYGSVSILNSVINGVSDYLYLSYPEEDCIIQNNVFNNSGRISTGTDDDNKVIIRNNTFYNDENSIVPEIPYAIENWATYSTSETIVENNSFLATDKIAIGMPENFTDVKLNAINNYWGTADETIIQSMIYDKNDNLLCNGYIQYQPFLLQPHQDSPILTINNENSYKISLFSNHPNPFNPSTKITYELPQYAKVDLSIYNILGEEIIKLVNENQALGRYTINWNGQNKSGAQVPGGIYFYTLRIKDFTKTRKMLLLR